MKQYVLYSKNAWLSYFQDFSGIFFSIEIVKTRLIDFVVAFPWVTPDWDNYSQSKGVPIRFK